MKDKNLKKQAQTKPRADRIADSLIESSNFSNQTYGSRDKLKVNQEEYLKLFKKKLAGIERSKRMIWRRNCAGFARELDAMLHNLKARVTNPLAGLKLVTRFFETDEFIFCKCDDSDGVVKDVFAINATDLFSLYASQYPDKNKVEKIVLKLYENNGYGVRDALIDRTAEFLPPKNIRSLISHFQKLADNQTDEIDKNHYLVPVRSLAKQIGDANIFKKARIDGWNELSFPDTIELVEIHIKNEEYDTAYNLLRKIPDDYDYMEDKKNRLMKKS